MIVYKKLIVLMTSLLLRVFTRCNGIFQTTNLPVQEKNSSLTIHTFRIG